MKSKNTFDRIGGMLKLIQLVRVLLEHCKCSVDTLREDCIVLRAQICEQTRDRHRASCLLVSQWQYMVRDLTDLTLSSNSR